MSTKAAPSYPEHEKLEALEGKNQTVGEFLEWLQAEKGIVLATQHEHNEHCTARGFNRCGYSAGALIDVMIPKTKLLAEFFEIDEDKLEREKLAMLDEMRDATIAARDRAAAE